MTHQTAELNLMKLLHRLTGLGVLLFLAIHVMHIALMGVDPAWFETIAALFRHPAARVLHIFLFFGVLFHAVNGLRLMLLECFPALDPYQRHSIYAAGFLVALVFIPGALLMLMDAFLPPL
jgi:succinate dehydrogenase / fumarate reductase cytochrome b subunit